MKYALLNNREILSAFMVNCLSETLYIAGAISVHLLTRKPDIFCSSLNYIT